jgi:crotonobetainyl-CoA:carnitine CoA-transferase CaiB-like acyl-CoA transferase
LAAYVGARGSCHRRFHGDASVSVVDGGNSMNVLAGVRVVDVTMWAFVPSAGGVLAHWGADVIKVESPRSPDPLRLLPGTAVGDGDSWFFKHYSRGKRGIALDLASDDGREILYQLVEGADIFLTSYLPKTRRKLKFDVDDIRAVNPRIIYARGTGQGPQGPDAEQGGYDGATWWCRGSLAQSTMNVAGVDSPTGMVGHGDGISGLTLAGGICAALVKRHLTGEPSVVDCSLLGTAIWFNGPSIISSGLGGDFMAAGSTAPREERHPTNQSIYRTKDDRFLITSMLGDFDDEWADFCEHLDRPDLIEDPRFSTSADRFRNRAAAVAVFDEIFAQHTLAEWKNKLSTTKGVWSPIQTPLEMFDDPQTVANGFLRTVDDPDGVVRLPIPPVLFDGEGGDPPVAPRVGEHTDEILEEVGLSAERISVLRSAGTIA